MFPNVPAVFGTVRPWCWAEETLTLPVRVSAALCTLTPLCHTVRLFVLRPLLVRLPGGAPPFPRDAAWTRTHARTRTRTDSLVYYCNASCYLQLKRGDSVSEEQAHNWVNSEWKQTLIDESITSLSITSYSITSAYRVFETLSLNCIVYKDPLFISTSIKQHLSDLTGGRVTTTAD